MKIICGLFIYSWIFLLTACSNQIDVQETKDLTLTFKIQNNGRALPGFESFNYPNGYQMLLSKFSLFISNIELRGISNNVSLAEIAFVDFLNGITTAAQAEEGISMVINDVPIDKYNLLSYAIGVSSDLNFLEPADFDNASALSNSGEYWIGWKSYIFHKTEGKIDKDGDGQFETNIALHVGSNAAYRESEHIVNFDLSQIDQLELIVDVNEIFKIENTYFDFVETPQIHHLGQLPQVLPIMDALATKIQVK